MCFGMCLIPSNSNTPSTYPSSRHATLARGSWMPFGRPNMQTVPRVPSTSNITRPLPGSVSLKSLNSIPGVIKRRNLHNHLWLVMLKKKRSNMYKPFPSGCKVKETIIINWLEVLRRNTASKADKFSKFRGIIRPFLIRVYWHSRITVRVWMRRCFI